MATFGEFRGDLTKLPHGAGVDLDLLTRFINNRIERMGRATDWTRLDKQGTLSVVGEYITGTISIAAGATSGTGTGTTFTSGMTGRRIRVNNTLPWYIFTFVGAGAFTIDRAYEELTDAVNVAFRIWQPVYTLPSDLAQLLSIENLTLGTDLDPRDREFVDDRDPSRMAYDFPRVWIPAEDSAAGLPQIELWPGPIKQVGLPINYRAKIISFARNDTSVNIPDWISIPALQAGVEADLYRIQKDIASANQQEAIFNQLLMEARGEDARKRPPAELNIADRYTNHRRRRTVRGYGDFNDSRRNWRPS